MTTKPTPTPTELELLTIIEHWSQAVRNRDLDAIRAHHAPDILMFDVPPPFSSRGLPAYMQTWSLFFRHAAKPITFHFTDIQITAADTVAFATATGHCIYIPPTTQPTPLQFRLTMGFRKTNAQWLITHEHHSIPATDQNVPPP